MLRLLVIELVSVCPRGIPRLSRYVVRRRMDRDLSVYEMNALAVKLAIYLVVCLRRVSHEVNQTMGLLRPASLRVYACVVAL